MRYKGYWHFTPMSECTTHTVDADSYEEASTKLFDWAKSHKSIVDCPWDFSIHHLDGYEITCEINEAHDLKAIRTLLRKKFGDDIIFTYTTDDVYAIFYDHDGGEWSRCDEKTATAIQTLLLKVTPPLFAYIDEVTENEA